MYMREDVDRPAISGRVSAKRRLFDAEHIYTERKTLSHTLSECDKNFLH